MIADRIPGPTGQPFLGSINAMRQDFLQFLIDTARDYGPVSRFRAGPASMVLLTNPDDIAEVLVKRGELFHKTRSTKRILAALLGDGLISLENSAHKRHRQIMQPSFHTRQVQNYTESVLHHTQAWLNQRMNGETLDLLPSFADLMLNIVVDTFFSASLTETQPIRAALQSFSKAMDLRVRSPIPLPQWLPTKSNRITRHALTTLDRVIYDLIAQRRQMREIPNDLLTGLLNPLDSAEGQKLTDKEIRDEIATIFFAGYETTTTTLAWFWYLLATHAPVWEGLLEERKGISDEDAKTMHRPPPYLDQVIKETLRLYPAAWLFDREPVEDTAIGGYTIPAGQTIFISPYLVQRSPNYFAEPEHFMPERFVEGAEKNLPRFAYFPFGGGARICIGQTFAQHTLALIVMALLPQLRFELIPGQTIRPAAAATLVPAHGIQMRAHRL